ncbi:MAG TPA: extracellular solute-binding protein [Gaiellaceae bacterium]|jgi:multiple sugar transport system substrate-binding protein|nr:extracellular solute-binding protein [Gaiellaceae bacterium]
MQGWRKALVLATMLASIAVLAVTAGLASAHGNKANIGNGTLNIMGFGKGDDVAETRAAIASKVVGGTINRPSGSFNDQTFLAAVASGNPPDLVYLDRQKVGSYAAKGAFMPLTSCIKSQKINMKQYRQAAVNEITYKNQIYGIPEFYDVRTILVDNKVLDQSGVSIGALNPAKPAALLAAAKKMVKFDSNGNVTRIGFDPKMPEFFPLWAKAYGVDILSKDGLHANLNAPGAVKALTYAMSLINAQGGWNKFKSFRDTWDFFGSDNQVQKNQVGAWPMEQWYYNVLASGSPDVHITALQFRNLKNQPINYETGSAWAIPKGAKNPQAACAWAKAMTSVSTWMAAARNRAALRKASKTPYTGISTGNSIADQDIYKQTYTSINPFFDEAVKKVLDVQRFSFGIPASPASAEFQAAWQNAVNRVLAGQQTPKQALDQAQKEATAAIKAATK